MNNGTFQKIVDIICDELDISADGITESSKIVSDLDVNSLELLNVIMVVEEELNITLEENRLRKIKTVGDLVKYVDELKN